MANNMMPGGGGRFQKMMQEGMSAGLAAWIGRKKYGKKKFQKMALRGWQRRKKAKGNR